MLAFFLLAFLCGASPNPEEAHDGTEVALAFAAARKGSRTVTETVVWSKGRVIARLPGRFQVRQWVPAWRALSLVRGTELYAWRIGQKSPSKVIDLADIVPSLTGEVPELYFTVSPDGLSMGAVTFDGAVYLIDIAKRQIVLKVISKSLEKVAKRGLAGTPSNQGIAWAPDSSGFAVALPAGPYRGSDDSAKGFSIFVARNGSHKPIGRGIPVAWISRSELLVGLEGPGFLTMSAAVLRLDGKPRISKIVAKEIGWNGRHILAAKNGQIRVFSADFKRIASYDIPSYTYLGQLPHSSLVGIPQSAIRDGARD